MRQHSPAIALLVTLLLAAASPPAVGAEEGSADGRMKKFERLVAAGVEFYRNEEYEDALQTFRSARSLIDHPKLSYKIGRTLQQLGRCEPARKAFERYLDYDELTEADRRRTEKHLRTLASCAEPATVAVTCEPKQTTLAVDGTEHACPADLQLQPGDYKLTASAEGYRTRTVELTVDAGERIDREVTLSPTSPPAGGGTRSDRAFPAPGPVWYDIVRYTALGAGLGLVAGGIASDASANRRLQKLRSARRAENWSRVDRLRSRADAARTRTAILYTTGTVLTAAGAAFLFIEHPGETDPTSAARRGRFQLTVGPTGLAAHWHW